LVSILRFVASVFYAIIGGLLGGVAGFVLVTIALRFGLDQSMSAFAGGVIVAAALFGAAMAVIGYLGQKGV